MAVTFNFYHSFKLKALQGKIDLSTHTIKAILATSTYTPSPSSHTEYANVTNELATANGYTAGGISLANIVLSLTSGVVKFDADDIFWSAVVSNIGPARYLILYDDTVTGDPLIAFIDFGEDKTAGVGTDFKANWASGGIITLS